MPWTRSGLATHATLTSSWLMNPRERRESGEKGAAILCPILWPKSCCDVTSCQRDLQQSVQRSGSSSCNKKGQGSVNRTYLDVEDVLFEDMSSASRENIKQLETYAKQEAVSTSFQCSNITWPRLKSCRYIISSRDTSLTMLLFTGTENHSETLRRDDQNPSNTRPCMPFKFLLTISTPGSRSVPFRPNTTLQLPSRGSTTHVDTPASQLTNTSSHTTDRRTNLPIYPDVNEYCHPHMAHSASGT